MTNKTFEPMGLVQLTKQLADSVQANIDSKRKQVDDFEDRLHSALDAKRDVASSYSRQLQDTIQRNQDLWQAGYDEGFKAGSAQVEETINRELLEAHGYDIDELVESVQETIKDHSQAIDDERRRAGFDPDKPYWDGGPNDQN
jgi:Skp family chaperone for outer membrane proteins